MIFAYGFPIAILALGTIAVLMIINRVGRPEGGRE